MTCVLAGSAEMTETSNAADATTVLTARLSTALATAAASTAVGDAIIAVTETDAAATHQLDPRRLDAQGGGKLQHVRLLVK